MPSVKYYTKFLTSDIHSTWGSASQTPCDARSRVGAHLSKLWSLWTLARLLYTFLCVLPLSSFLQDTCEQVRDRFVHKLNKGLKSLRLPLGYLSVFALAGIEPRKETRIQVLTQNDSADFLKCFCFNCCYCRLLYQLLWPYLLLHTYMQYTVIRLIVVFMYIQNHRLMLGNVEKRRECLKQHSKAKGMHQLHARRKCSLVHACAYTVKPL